LLAIRGLRLVVPLVKDELRVTIDSRIVVSRTRDGGKSFETISRGLPDEPAFDVVYRHALAIDDRGERLAFGSTTGSLFVSDDGGESFSCLSKHLPPIYAVTFGAS